MSKIYVNVSISEIMSQLQQFLPYKLKKESQDKRLKFLILITTPNRI